METQMKKLTKVSLNSDSLQLDLMIEILKRLPVKTLIRFLCVSKQWASIIRSGYFKKLFLNESLTRPKGILFTFRTLFKGLALASVHLSSSSASLSYITDHTRDCMTVVAPSVHGLICYRTTSSRLVIHNFSTRRSLTLPMIYTRKRPIDYYLGYDPIGNVYKVLAVIRTVSKKLTLAEEIRVLTLGTENSWRRMIQDVIPLHSPLGQELCINGVLYYRAFCGIELKDCAIMSFDVRSEKLDLIKGLPCNFLGRLKLTNYEGKLALMSFENKLNGTISLWVLEDAAKEEWSNKIFDLPNLIGSKGNQHLQNFRIVDIDTDNGELISASFDVRTPLFSVCCCDMEKNSMRRVTINGITKECIGWYVDAVSYGQVENLMFL